MSEQALERFLSSQIEGQVDSTSSFTIDPAKALQKLAGYQLREVGLWAVKLVQGAVARGCSEARFVLEATRLRFSCFGGGEVDAGSLLEQVCSGATPADRSDRHWVTGLRGAYRRGLEQLSWTSRLNGAHSVVTITGGEVKVQVPRSSPPGDASFEVVADYPSSWLNMSSLHTDEYAALCKYCRLCAMPVRVDSRLISRQAPESAGKAYFHVTWVQHAQSSGQSGFELHPGEEALPSTWADAKPLVFERPLPGQRTALLLNVSGAQEQSRALVFWSKDGVLLGPRQLTFKSSTRMELVLPGDQLETDLSEWTVRDATIPVDLILELARTIAAQLEAHPVANPAPRHPVVNAMAGLGEVGLWVGLNLLALCFCGLPCVDPLGWQKARAERANLLAGMRSLAAQTTLKLEPQG